MGYYYASLIVVLTIEFAAMKKKVKKAKGSNRIKTIVSIKPQKTRQAQNTKFSSGIRIQTQQSKCFQIIFIIKI